MTYLVWDGESLFEKDGSLIQVSEDECCCITTTGSTSGSTDTDTATGTGSTSDSGPSGSGSGSGSTDTTGYPSGSGGSAECVEDSDCCVCNYRIEKEDCSLESCPDGWIDDGFFCIYMSEFYVNCESDDLCPPAPIDDLGDVECCQGWNESSEEGYGGSCVAFTEEDGVCCNGECEEDCCDYREEPELCDSESCTNDTCPEERQVYDETTGETYCCPEGCPPDQEYHSDGSGYGDADGPCCCTNPEDCTCFCGCEGPYPCEAAEGGGQANCEALGPNCVFEFGEDENCGCDCGYAPEEFASIEDCDTSGADVDAICGTDCDLGAGSYDLQCWDPSDPP